MLYFANPCGPNVIAAMQEGRIGFIDTPAQGNVRPDGVVWCADNGAFSDKFDEAKWWKFLQTNAHQAGTCVFAVAPDVVGDAAATLARSLPWLQPIRALGYPAAFVAQNRAEHITVPWEEFDVLFLGGSPECLPCGYIRPSDAPRPPRGKKPRCPICGRMLTEWKVGRVAESLTREAKRRGKHVHMGRVNGGGRVNMAEHWGCDSVDGTYLVFGADKNLPKLLGWMERANHHLFAS